MAEMTSGMYASVFLILEKKIALKYYGNETSENIPAAQNSSRHILQPYCLSSVAGNVLSIFPLIDTSEITDGHVTTLREGLAKEGFIFDDYKKANVGRVGDVPYSIDGDAVFIDGTKNQTTDSSRICQWRILPRSFPTDHQPDKKLVERFWKFAPEIEVEVFGTRIEARVVSALNGEMREDSKAL